MTFSKHTFLLPDASYDFTHGPDPVICESSGLTPKGTNVKDES